MNETDRNAQECLDILMLKELFGDDFFIVDPMDRNQANEAITHTILLWYKSKKRKTLKQIIKHLIEKW